MKKNINLYNVLFPIWFVVLASPIIWLIIIPANFIIDSVVLLIAMKLLKVDNIRQNYIKTIMFVWLFGFAADIIGEIVLTALMFSQGLFPDVKFIDDVISALCRNPFVNIWSMILILAIVALSAFFIYLFNMKFSFLKFNSNIDKTTRHKIALSLAICTAPYLFLIPSEWFWKGVY